MLLGKEDAGRDADRRWRQHEEAAEAKEDIADIADLHKHISHAFSAPSLPGPALHPAFVMKSSPLPPAHCHISSIFSSAARTSERHHAEEQRVLDCMQPCCAE